jgi:hypothetical protein
MFVARNIITLPDVQVPVISSGAVILNIIFIFPRPSLAYSPPRPVFHN